MAYMGRKSVKDLAPNHPFAETAIHFGQGQIPSSATASPPPSPTGKPALTRQDLENSRPKPEDFRSQDEFEEALGYWNSHVGRILSMTAPSKASPLGSPSTDEK